MDPDANIKEQLSIANGVLDADAYDPDELPRLAELVVSLDEWIAGGGAAPSRWTRNAKAVQSKRGRRQAEATDWWTMPLDAPNPFAQARNSFMDTITGLLGKLTGGGGDEKKGDDKRPSSAPAPAASHSSAAHPPPTSSPSTSSRDETLSPLFWPPR